MASSYSLRKENNINNYHEKSKTILLATCFITVLGAVGALTLSQSNLVDALALKRTITVGDYSLTIDSGHKLQTANNADRLSDKYINTGLGNRVYFEYGVDDGCTRTGFENFNFFGD